MVIESDATRKALQEHIFVESGLLLRLIGEIRKYYPKPRDLEGGNEDGGEEADGTNHAESDADELKHHSHPPTLGHFLNIVQAINITFTNNPENDSNEFNSNAQDATVENNAESDSIADGEENAVQKSDKTDEPDVNDINISSQTSLSTMSAIMAGDAIASEWKSFLEEILRLWKHDRGT